MDATNMHVEGVRLSDVTTIDFKRYEDPTGVLCVYEGSQQIPFDIRRVFTVSAKRGETRGRHAHKQCAQLLVAVCGEVQVRCDNGLHITQYLLDNMYTGLLVSPGIWTEELYMTDGAVLMVLCDRVYEEDDYIRDYAEFQCYVKNRAEL
ncbi:MAG: FdtA/QdtA family cupin domain-containing protein [Mariprofundales bacterium]|nr:FdtA/QdtA family cupin domain-containing protein [Mariprofundales bacterium]